MRGTVQADILKEDQAQNTCIFSTEFALRMMGDIQAVFVDHKVRNFYSVSISGYHIAEAGANPITQLAFTLANGFTYVEYYLSRGMDIDDFAPNLASSSPTASIPSTAVIGRVARRIWAKAMRRSTGRRARPEAQVPHPDQRPLPARAGDRVQRHPHDAAGSVRAFTTTATPAHQRLRRGDHHADRGVVRRAIAIQLIINKELGLAKNENPLQGSFIIEELTDLVEEAVMVEFDRLTERGGRARRHGNHVPAQPHPRGEPALRDAEAHGRVPHHRA